MTQLHAQMTSIFQDNLENLRASPRVTLDLRHLR
jgi:hypothetical protein